MRKHSERVRTIDLGYEQMLMFEGGPGSRVRVLHGATWLTEPEVARDAFLGAGDEHALERAGAALVEGLAPSRIEILEGARAGWLRRAWAALRRGLASHRARAQFGPAAGCAQCA